MKRFLSVEAIRRWSILSTLREWNTDKSWSIEWREFLSKLTPPFVPENDILIFDASFFDPKEEKNDFVVYVKEIVYPSFRLDFKGVFLATDSRLIFASREQGIRFQVTYESIRAVYHQKLSDTIRMFQISLDNGSTLTINFQIPSVGGLGSALAGFFGSAATQTYIEALKVEEITKFHNNFLGFLNDIVNKNKLRRI